MGRSKAPSLPIKALSFCRPTELRGKGGGASHQRGNAFPTPAGRLYGFPTGEARLSGFSRQRRYKKWRRRRRTSPAQRYYITPEGESPQTACKAKPITGRTLAAQGRKARRRHQPSRRSRVNLREYRKAPPRSRSRPRRRRLNPQARQGLSPFPSFFFSMLQYRQL